MMNYTPEDLLEYLYTAPKLREDALHALSHNDIDFSFIPVPPECLFLNRGGVFLKTQCEDGSVKSQNFEPDAERFKAKLRGFRKENTRIFIIHYKDETNLEFMTKKNKEETMKSIKSALEGLTGKIEGLEKMLVLTDKLPSSSGDLMMDSLFTDDEALKNYQKNPLHLEVANGLVRPNVEIRLSFDFEE